MATLVQRVSPKNAAVLVEPIIPSSEPIEGEPGAEPVTDSVPEKPSVLPSLNFENESYLGELQDDETLSNLKDVILSRTKSIIEKCVTYKESYDQYAYLWTVISLNSG